MIKKAVNLKKEEGSAAISHFLPLLTVIVTVAMLMVSYAGYIKILDTKDEIDLVIRKYIIRMETAGYLIPEDEAALISELKALGVSNIDLTGTTLSETGYGDIIDLCVSGTLTVDVYTITSAIDGDFGTETMQLNEQRSSTSQQ